MKTTYILLFTLALILLIQPNIKQNFIFAQNCVCANCGAPCRNPMVHYRNCPDYVKPKSNKSYSSSTDFDLKLIQTLINVIFSNIFIDDAEKEKQLLEQQKELEKIAAENEKRRILKEQIAQELHDKFMALYKQLPGSEELKEKKLSDYFEGKSFDGDSNELTYKQIDISSPDELTYKTDEVVYTNFFGTRITVDDAQLLIDPDNDPMIVDLRNTNEFIKGKQEEDKLTVGDLKSDEVKKEGEPIVVKENCMEIKKQLAGHLKRREDFQKTVYLASSQLDEWKESTKDAMTQIAKDAASFAFEKILNNIKLRNEKALDIKTRFVKYEKELRAKGTDYDSYLKKLDKQILKYDLAELTENFLEYKEYIDAMVNTTHVLVVDLCESDKEMMEMLNYPGIKESLGGDYSTEEAADFAFGKDCDFFLEGEKTKKWLGKSFLTSVPVVAYSQLGITAVYDLTNLVTSYYRVIQANNINDKVLEASMNIQNDIDETYFKLKDCK